MRILLDTHIYLWALSEPKRLSIHHRDAIESARNVVFVSAVSIAEIAIKVSLKKLAIRFDPVAEAEKYGFELLPFRAEEALRLQAMPFHHRDPFDRMLIAQSQANGMPLISDDPQFKRYECELM